MQNLKYQLIISDYDGTFRHTDGSIGEITINAIKKFTENGGKFALCTGRMLTSILPIAQQLNLEGLVAAYQGSVLADIQTGKVVHSGGFTKEEALKICKILEEKKQRIHVYTLNDCYVNYQDDYLSFYENVCKIKSIIDTQPLSKRIENTKEKIYKILAMVEPSERMGLRDELQVELGENFFVSCSSQFLVEITHKNDTKGKAVDFLCDYYKVPKEKTIAFGDQQNDSPMLQEAGIGIAMENGDEGVKNIADYITESCDKDGVGLAIEKFVY